MQKAAKTADILRKLGLDVNTYDLSDTSSENVQLMEDTKAKMSLAEAHASVCLKTGESCVLNKISYVPQEVNQVIEQQNALASMLGYTEDDGDTSNIIAQVKVVKAKDDAFDSSFKDVVGVELSGFAREDADAFTREASLKYSEPDPCSEPPKDIHLYQGTLQAIGKTVLDNDFCLTKQNARSVVDSVHLLGSNQALSKSYANQTLVALNARDISANPTQADVLSKVTNFIDNIKKLNAKVGVKESDYAGKEIADVIGDVAIPNLKMLFGYQNVINALKYPCYSYTIIAQSGTPERVALYNACSSFVYEYAPSNSLRQVCTNMYYNDAGIIKTVGSANPVYQYFPEVMAIICESFNGMKNVATGETISIDLLHNLILR
ncbi:hypothetical protein [Candidatus Lariskella endosymbiont of Hedychridium roseum]|uniref:hypothetical protein n=1 Tax=Candidatus Lariskella endosymbiont of Hedychridium roseum TaxID=3077949 RepID=UPI0030CE9DBF